MITTKTGKKIKIWISHDIPVTRYSIPVNSSDQKLSVALGGKQPQVEFVRVDARSISRQTSKPLIPQSEDSLPET